MHKGKDDNSRSGHNATITAYPPILFPATGQARDGVVIQQWEEPKVLDYSRAGDGTGPTYADWGLEPPQNVREFTPAFLMRGSPEHQAMEATISITDRERVRALYFVKTATKGKGFDKAAPLLIKPKVLQTAFAAMPPEAKNWFYPPFFTREMKRARVVMWLRNDQQFLPAIYVPNMTVAFFVAAAFRRVVACPACGVLFVPEAERLDGSRSEKYHTVACGQRYRQKQFRIRHKLKAKKGKQGKERKR
ncbi:MAG: hypothetical protein WB952_05315 [Terriglobales bacterium]